MEHMVDLDDNDDPTTMHLLADDTLREMIQRGQLLDRSDGSVTAFTGWKFSNVDDVDSEMLLACGPQIQFLKVFRKNWRLETSKFRFPDGWQPNDDLSEPFATRSARYELDMWVQEAGDVFHPLSRTETIARHYDMSSFEPDFLLSVSRRVHFWEAPVEIAFRIDANHSLQHFKPIVFYTGDERGAGAVISGAFMCTPGCWMRCNPLSCFPARVAGSQIPPDIDFALLLNPLGSSSELGLRRDRCLRLSLMHPALVVGVKGPVAWPKSLAGPRASQQPMNEHAAIENLAMAVQPSLDTHLLNWQLRCEQVHSVTSSSNIQLPPWFVVFGVIYDAENIVIVAHIPFIVTSTKNKTRLSVSDSRFSYLSCVVDRIRFAPVPTEAPLSQLWFRDRFSAAFALVSLQTQAFRLASLWENVVWPRELSLAEANREREYRGPTPTPSERSTKLPGWDDPLFPERPLTSSEQQAEVDDEIQETYAHAQEVLPDLLRWVQDVADCASEL